MVLVVVTVRRCHGCFFTITAAYLTTIDSRSQSFSRPFVNLTISGLRPRAMETILILTTGGTIDKIYFDAKSAYEVGPPSITLILAALNLSISYRVIPVLRKDSLDLTDADRQLIYDQVAGNEERLVLITHGTDTMVQTAEKLKDIHHKTIVLTGALEPALFRTSDALFNIGCGLAAVQSLGDGIYIVMSGRVFRWDNVRKNLQSNRFEPITDE